MYVFYDGRYKRTDVLENPVISVNNVREHTLFKIYGVTSNKAAEL